METIKQAMGKSIKPEKPVKLYSHALGPNPWKVAIILEELEIPYEQHIMNSTSLRQEPFQSVNPNGRVPAIEDANTGIKLWESGAIIEYLLETYDASHSLSYAEGAERFEQKCWLHFQMSGQGPYFGQRAWFLLYHPEKNLTSALERYGDEIRRVMGVIDTHLGKTGAEYLVGARVTYADLAFVPWHWLLLDQPLVMGEGFAQEWREKFPRCWAWHERLSARPAVRRCREAREQVILKAQG